MMKMNKAKIACAIWPWGLETKEQMIQALKDISEIGYTGFESVKAAINVFNGDANELKSVVDEFGVKPVSFYFHIFGDEKEDIEDLQRKMDFLAKLDVKRISLQANYIEGRKPTEEELVKVLKTIEKIGVITKDYGVVPCIHPHHNTMVMHEDEIDFIMKNTDPEYIAFGPDTAHLAVGLCDPVKVMEKYAERIKFLHLKDYYFGEYVGSEGIGYENVNVYQNFRELGEGNIDFKKVFKVLKDVNYDGYMCTELDGSRFGNKISAEMNYKYVSDNY